MNSYTLQRPTPTFQNPRLQDQYVDRSLRFPIERISTSKAKRQSLILQDRGKTTNIPFEEILYLKASHVYVEIICKNGRKILRRDSLTRLLQQLPAEDFIQTHRSFAINKSQVSTWDHSNIYIQDAVIPMSRSRRKTIKELLSY